MFKQRKLKTNLFRQPLLYGLFVRVVLVVMVLAVIYLGHVKTVMQRNVQRVRNK